MTELQEESDANRTSVRRRPVQLTIGILVLTGIGMTADVGFDVASGTPPAHAALEALLAVLAVVGAASLIRELLVARKDREQAERALAVAQTRIEETRRAAQQWRAQTEELLRGLGEAIEVQFESWGLTPAEREVGLLLLKGLSFKELAEIRQTSERTVRQQANAVYKKAGLAGRAELSAFFLEDLLLPTQLPADARRAAS